MTDEILRIDNGKMRPMSSRSFRDGFLGKTLEDGLQELIEHYPGIIPGRQISSGSDDPPRFLLLCREMSVGGWSLDFLLVDQYAIPTLVEAKLVENPESRRAVIGQIIEYAANAADNWLGGKLFEKASKYYADKGFDLNELVTQLTENDDESASDFFDRIENNLMQGKMRLIITADKLRPEVRKVIEYLNAETRSIEILGLEISFYGDDDESFVLVPTIVGQSQIIANKKSGSEKPTTWDYQLFVDELGKLDKSTLTERLENIASWAKDAGVFVAASAKDPAFGLQGRHGRRIFTFYINSIYCFLHPSYHGDSARERDDFVTKLKVIPIFNFSDKVVSEAKEGRTAFGTIDSISDDEFENFMKILKEVCGS